MSSSHVVKRALEDVIVRVDAAYGPDGWGYGIASTAIMFGVIIGGLVVLFGFRQALLRALAWLYMKSCKSDYIRVGTEEGTGKPIYAPNESKKYVWAITHVSLEFVFLVLVVAVIWFGYFSAGFNFLNSPYIGLALSITATYMFGAALTNLSAKILNNAENLFVIGTYVRLPTLGPEVHGFISEQTAFHVMLIRRDEHGARRRIKVTCADFFNHTVHEDTYTQYSEREAEALEISKEMKSKLAHGSFVERRRFVDDCGPRKLKATISKLV